MTHVETATATARNRRRSSSTPATPEELMIRLKNQYPNEDREQRIARFARICVELNLFHYELSEYWGRFHHNRLAEPRPIRNTPQPEERKAAEAAKAAEDNATKEAVKQGAIAKILSLNFIMPDGKAVRDCTGTELEKFGGTLAKIGKKVGNRIVGKVLSDAQFRKLCE